MKKPQDEKNDILNDEEFIKKCGRIFARDLLRYSENGGSMKNITATKVYKFLEELDKRDKE